MKFMDTIEIRPANVDLSRVCCLVTQAYGERGIATGIRMFGKDSSASIVEEAVHAAILNGAFMIFGLDINLSDFSALSSHKAFNAIYGSHIACTWTVPRLMQQAQAPQNRAARRRRAK